MLSSRVSPAGLTAAAVAGLLRRLLYGIFVLALLALAAALGVAALPRLFGYHALLVALPMTVVGLFTLRSIWASEEKPLARAGSA